MDELYIRAVDEIIGKGELEQALKGGKKLRLKLGVDPSSPDIHLGHAVILRKLRQLQEMGHTVIFLIGDVTARIGDPSGRNKTRPVLTQAQIDANAKTYLDQVGKILDIDKAEIRRNSEWLDKLSFDDLLKLAGNFSVAQLTEREDFKNRLTEGQELGLHELLYPVMQAYDSVMLKADVEFGGTDQRFNMLAGRALQKKMDQKPQQVFLTKLIVGLDGVQKMSKSLGNYIGVTDTAADIFGKVMSIPDTLILPYYELCTGVDMAQAEQLVQNSPRDAKSGLAKEIVTLYHSQKAGEAAEDAFNKQFRDKEAPTDIAEVKVSGSDGLDILVQAGLASSRSDARRLVVQGGLRRNGEVVSDIGDVKFVDGDTIQAGKRRFVRLKLK